MSHQILVFSPSIQCFFAHFWLCLNDFALLFRLSGVFFFPKLKIFQSFVTEPFSFQPTKEWSNIKTVVLNIRLQKQGMGLSFAFFRTEGKHCLYHWWYIMRQLAIKTLKWISWNKREKLSKPRSFLILLVQLLFDWWFSCSSCLTDDCLSNQVSMYTYLLSAFVLYPEESTSCMCIFSSPVWTSL